MKKYFAALLITYQIFAAGCSNDHLINDKAYRLTVEKDFSARRKTGANRNKELYGVFDQDLDKSREEALKFLYAYMPLSDMADYSGEFFLANVDMALKARKESPWRKDIPEDIFLHYVLPYRVNNENLDSFRLRYYDEIRNRIKGLSLADAALEINHWCHEKVTYQPSDIRTSSPMNTILSARGRCGEESTFTVASLRAAGIPARQVYTPRWAHTDDNHAWVEVWINGEWHYMGACEPEPVLDRGWFTEPARRAMLVHSKSFGAAYGNENVISKMKYYTEVNNLSKYAVTKRIFVRVIDDMNNPVSDATVEYKLYNYAEFYSLASLQTDVNGLSSLETGMADLLIWVSKDNKFNYRLVSVPGTDTVIMNLRDRINPDNPGILDITVPPVQDSFPSLPEDLAENNKRRFEEENRIRQAYVDSWIKPSEAKDFANKIKADTSAIIDVFSRSMGNWRAIKHFLDSTPADERELALSLLRVLPDKDLRDISAAVLSDHLRNTINPLRLDPNDSFFKDRVLNPRVAGELLTAYRSYFRNALPSFLKADAVKSPDIIIDYINREISVNDAENYYMTPLTPIGVHELKISDRNSRKIYFVAVCRSLGIPSRLEPGSNVPQYYFNSEWKDVYFADEKAPEARKAFLKLVSDEKNPVPEYYTHFTIARLENGHFKTLDFDYGKKITDFSEELALAPGDYMIVTGRRLASGNVLADLAFFRLAPGEHVSREIRLRNETR
jgi:transglutaminase-like putative cysteine protease